MVPPPLRSSSLKVIAGLAAIAMVFAGLRALQRAPRRSILLGDTSARIEERVEAVGKGPEVQRAWGELFDDVGANPEMAPVLGALAARLGADPELTAGVAAFFAEVGRDPVMTRAIEAFARAHPELDDGAFGPAFGAEIQARFAARGAAGFERSVRRLAAGLDVDIDAAQFVAGLGQLTRLKATLDEGSHIRAWEDRIVELNGGTVPDPERANEILLAHAYADARVTTLMTSILRDPAFRAAVRAVVRATLADPTVQDALVAALRRLAGSPALRARAVAVFAALAAPEPDPATVNAALDALLSAPEVRAEARAVAIAALRSPAIVRVADDAIGRLVDAPTLRRTAATFVDAW